MGEYTVESTTYQYRGQTWDIRIEYEDSPSNPLEEWMDTPKFWIHDNARRSWGYLNTCEIGDFVDPDVIDARLEREYDQRKRDEIRYRLGEKLTDERIAETENLRRRIAREVYGFGNYLATVASMIDGIVLPLYGYEHSGQTISTGSFSCPWDSGPIGMVIMTKDMMRERMLWKHVTKARMMTMIELVKCDVRVLDSYVRGEVYCVICEGPNGEYESLGDMQGYDEAELFEQGREMVRDAVDGHYDELVENSVLAFAEDVSTLLADMSIYGIDDPVKVNTLMTRLEWRTKQLPPWRQSKVYERFVQAAA